MIGLTCVVVISGYNYQEYIATREVLLPIVLWSPWTVVHYSIIDRYNYMRIIEISDLQAGFKNNTNKPALQYELQIGIVSEDIKLF